MNNRTINTLIKIKNASVLKKPFVVIPYSDFYLAIVKLFYNNGLVQYYAVYNKKNIKIYFRLVFENTLLKNIKMVSTPTKKKFMSYKNICKIKNINNFLIFSTNLGLLTLKQCKAYRIGGFLLFKC